MLPEHFALSRPLVFFDTETTGVDVAKARIVELCGIKIHPDRKREEFHQRFNPGIPIPPEATAVHRITDEMVAHEPTFKQALPRILDFFSNCDFAGYNIVRFDVPLFVEELLRNGATHIPFANAKLIDCYKVWQKKAPRTLTDALRHYAEEEIQNAHSAQADVEATMRVFAGQLRKHDDLLPDLNHIHDYCNEQAETLDYAGRFARDPKGDIVFTFGKNKGLRAADHPGMLEWILKNDFAAHTKYIAQCLLKGELK